MTTINSISTTSEINQQKYSATEPNSSMSLGLFGYGFNEVEQQTTELTNSISSTNNDSQTAERNVKNILGENFFNSLSDEYKAEVIKKYQTIDTFCKNNGKNISDAEMSRRLTNYINALKANAEEQKMGEYFISGGDAFNYTGESVVDENVKQQKATGTDEEYFCSILDRGNGTVQLYDTNGDNLVSLDEFIAGEANDWKDLTGEDITEEMKSATEQYFNKIDRDDEKGYLNSVELASHEYARATLDDTNKNSNEELTFKEWYLSSLVGSSEDPGGKITSRYDYASNQIYEVLKQYNE